MLLRQCNTARKLLWSLPNFLQVSQTQRGPAESTSNVKCQLLASVSYLKSDRSSVVGRLHASCEPFSPQRFQFHVDNLKWKRATRADSTNVESQSSVCPIPINYFTSTEPFTGILFFKLKFPQSEDTPPADKDYLIWRWRRWAKQFKISEITACR